MTEGSGTAEDVKLVKLRLNNAEGLVLDSTNFAGYISFKIREPYNKLQAGQSITLMMTYDFQYRDPACSDQLKDFYAWINRTHIGANAETHPGVILPLPSPIKTVESGSTVLDCVHNIDTPEIFTKIQEAIDDPDTRDGHTILVCPGRYIENVNVDHSLTIRSIKGYAVTTIQTEKGEDHVFRVEKDNTTISGFTIRGANGDEKAGVYCQTVLGSKILKNLMVDNYNGVLLFTTRAAEIIDNIIYGISLINSYDNRIGGNRKNKRGNWISGNIRSGISILDSLSINNCILGNIIGPDSTGKSPYKSRQVDGIFLEHVKHNFIGGKAEGEGNII